MKDIYKEIMTPIIEPNYYSQSVMAVLLGGGMAPQVRLTETQALIALAQSGRMAQQKTIEFKRYGSYGVKRHLSFFDELRVEIDNWLHS